MTLGDVIRKFRWEKGWSVRVLSEKSGIARQTITNAEYGRRGTSVAVLIELLDTMGYELIVSEKIKNEDQTRKYRSVEAVINN